MRFDPHEPGRRTEKFAKDAQEENFLLALNNLLRDADLPQPHTSQHIERLPLIYIVGTPRSGTTLLSQLISRYLPVGYINNLIARFWSRPSVGIKLSRAILGEDSRQDISFSSTHGTTQGISNPHEFGYFWRYWLKLDQAPTHHLSAQALEAVDWSGLKKALQQEILASFNNPVVFKNIICGFHAAFLTGLHPASLFINIKRDLLTTAASILKVRQERFGSYQVWWSLKPSTYPFDVLGGDAAAEVAMQVIACRQEIDEELSQPGVKSISLTYDELCARPGQVIDRICLKLAEMGQVVQPLSLDFPNLTVTGRPKLPAGLETKLKSYLSELL